MANEGFMDLDRLIQTCEFENKQYVKLIEKENQQIEALEREIEEKQRESLKLEEAISQLDEDTKRAHKQFTLNRDNCDSLRKTMVVLMEHEVALHRKHNCLIANGEDERLQHDGVVKHYEGIYSDYMSKYQTFPLVKDLQVYEEEISAKEKVLQEVQQKNDHLKKEIDVAQGGSEVNFKDLNKFITKLIRALPHPLFPEAQDFPIQLRAEVKLDTSRAVFEKTQFETELRDIQNKNSRQEEESENGGNQVPMREDQTNTGTTDDSFGEDMSTMIGIFHNKSDAVEEERNTNNSADILQPIAELSLQASASHDLPLKCVDPPQTQKQPEEGVIEIPVTRISDISISRNQPLASIVSAVSHQSPTVVRNSPSVPSSMSNTGSPSLQVDHEVNKSFISMQLLNVIPQVSPVVSGSPGSFNIKPLVSQVSPVINRAPVGMPGRIQIRAPVAVNTMVGNRPRTTISPVSANRPQTVLIPTFAPQATNSAPRSFTPQTVEPPQVQMVSKLTPKIKHGVSSIQSKQTDLTPPVRQIRPSLLIPVQEQRKSAVCPPRAQVLASPQIRSPPHLPIPPPPPTAKTPEVYKGPDSAVLSRFVSPISQPHSCHRTPVSTTSVVSRQLYGSPVTSSPNRQQTLTTPRHKQSPDQTPASNRSALNTSSEDITMESPERPKSRPTTPGRLTDLEANSRSPFDLEKHLKQIDYLTKSPGAPMYSQRPMFEHVESNAGEKSPGPFVQSFKAKPTNISRSEPEQQRSSFIMNTSSPDTSLLSQGVKSLFGGHKTPEVSQTAETSFMFGGCSESPAVGSSFLSMFSSDEFQSSSSAKTPQSNFSFSFGKEDTPKPASQDFPFSFGGSSNDERSPSVFNLF